ncbi:hypothetical protein BY458DRAFT_527543 [Sporodiniella umbellata]|nr:hypothetical protein BY458DRAFT_527543 [Sporodiniella umbellata]
MSKDESFADFEVDEVYEVESLCAHRPSARDHNKSYEYLVKWKDYGEEHNTWEREKNIFAKDLIAIYWRRHNLQNETSTETNKHDAITNAKLLPKPPEGQTWSDLESVESVYVFGDSVLVAELKWKNEGQFNTFVPTRIVRQKSPLKLIEYYQSKIKYKPLL